MSALFIECNPHGLHLLYDGRETVVLDVPRLVIVVIDEGSAKRCMVHGMIKIHGFPTIGVIVRACRCDWGCDWRNTVDDYM